MNILLTKKSVGLPKKNIENIHYVFEFIGTTNTLNEDYQGFLGSWIKYFR